jgi:hypothetical protein
MTIPPVVAQYTGTGTTEKHGDLDSEYWLLVSDSTFSPKPGCVGSLRDGQRKQGGGIHPRYLWGNATGSAGLCGSGTGVAARGSLFGRGYLTDDVGVCPTYVGGG